MNKVIFYQTITEITEQNRVEVNNEPLKLEMDLPFIPTREMSISYGNGRTIESDDICSIFYDVKEKKFNVYLHRIETTWEYKKIIETFETNGWKKYTGRRA